MSAPYRVQLKRTKGWRKPENTVVVSRPTRWGNPFIVSPKNAAKAEFDDKLWRCVDSVEEAVRMFSDMVTEDEWRECLNYPDPSELRGKNLACWCPPDKPCHADVLLVLANQPHPIR